MRRAWLRVHRWVALAVGFVFALLGASGALMVLRGPILEWEVGAAALRLQARPAPGAVPAPPAAWRAAARAGCPQLERIMGAAAPRTGFLRADNAVVFGTLRTRPAMGIATVDPYTAQVRACFVYDDLALAKVVALHRSLFLPRPWAGPALGACALLLLASLGTGAWLWWPRGMAPGRWRRALGFGWGVPPAQRRRWRELHNAAAGWLFLPLLALAASGAWLAQPAWFAGPGAGAALKPLVSALHATLMLGAPGEAAVFLAGLALPALYVSGLVLWWRRRRAQPAR